MKNSSKRTILFISSAPKDLPPLRLGEELRNIQQILKCPEKFIVNNCMSARPTDITQAFLEYEPNIVHYAGHSLKTGELCFENDCNKMQPVEPDVLADVFGLISDQIDCVLLNSCYSTIQADAIVKHISYAIGMNQNISDEAAIAFSKGFYKAIKAGRSIKKAFRFGCIEIRLNSISKNCSEYKIPELLTKEKSTISKEKSDFKWELKLKGKLTDENRHKAELLVAELCKILGGSSLKIKGIE